MTPDRDPPDDRDDADDKPMPGPDPRPGHNPGYDDSNPRTEEEAHIPAPGVHPGIQPNPEAGGLKREQGDDPDPTRGH